MTNNCPQPPPRRRASLIDELPRSSDNAVNNQYSRRVSNHNNNMRGSFTFGRGYSMGEGEVMIEGKRSTTANKGRRFRRLSFDKNDEAKQNTGDATDLADYQTVFQQMKHQNPTAPLGLLQQKTMRRMSELKAEKEEMEKMNAERLRELDNLRSLHRKSLLGSLFHHHNNNAGGAAGSGRMSLRRPRAASDLSDKNSCASGGVGSVASDRDNPNTSNSNSSSNNSSSNATATINNKSNHHHERVKPKAPYDVDDSFISKNSIDDHHESLTNVISRATTLISRKSSSFESNGGGLISRKSSSFESNGGGEYYGSRRSTIDSNPLSEADLSIDSNGDLPTILRTSILRSSLLGMGEEQKGNLAPRKSVGDFTTMYDQSSDEDEDDCGVDLSGVSGLSKMSGLYISGDDDEDEEGQQVTDDKDDREEEQNDDSDQESITGEELDILETHIEQLGTSQGSLAQCDVSNTTDTYHSMLSESSHTLFTEASHNDAGSLIVGFGTQREEREDESRGFAADFSAWDNR